MADATATLPTTADLVIKNLNLPNVKAVTDLIDENSLIVMAWLEEVMDEDEYDKVAAVPGQGEDTADAKMVSQCQKAYAYAMFREIALMLNLNTAGKGILQTTGFAESKTSVMSGDEVAKLQAKFDLMALDVIREYLNDAGTERLDRYKSANANQVRLAVIKGEDSTDPAWNGGW